MGAGGDASDVAPKSFQKGRIGKVKEDLTCLKSMWFNKVLAQGYFQSDKPKCLVFASIDYYLLIFTYACRSEGMIMQPDWSPSMVLKLMHVRAATTSVYSPSLH